MNKKLKKLIASGLVVLNMGAVLSPMVGAISPSDYPIDPIVMEMHGTHEQDLMNSFREFKHRVDGLLNQTVLKLNRDLSVWTVYASPYDGLTHAMDFLENASSCRELVFAIGSSGARRIGLFETEYDWYFNSAPRGEDMKFMRQLIEDVHNNKPIQGDNVVKAAKQLVVLNAVICLNNLVRKLYAKCCMAVRLTPDSEISPEARKYLEGRNSTYIDLLEKLFKTWCFGINNNGSKRHFRFCDHVMYWEFMNDNWINRRSNYFKEMKDICFETLNYLSATFPDRASYDKIDIRPGCKRIISYISKLSIMCSEIPKLIDEVGL